MNTQVRFAKMHGLGNDFVVIDAVTQQVKIDSQLARKIAHRHFGVGCDQILIVEPPINPEDDFYYRIFNANGHEVEQCGNGARCLGRFIRDEGLSCKPHLKVGYKGGRMKISLEAENQVTVELGPPKFEPKQIPIKALRKNHLERYQIKYNNQIKDISALSLGNPHCVISVSSIKEAKVQEIGKQLQQHPAFPKGVNVGFMQVLARNHIKLRVFERGAGETFACGTGACAAVIAGVLHQDLGLETKVDMRGGSVFVSWPDTKGPVYLTGPTQRMFDGVFMIKST